MKNLNSELWQVKIEIEISRLRAYKLKTEVSKVVFLVEIFGTIIKLTEIYNQKIYVQMVHKPEKKKRVVLDVNEYPLVYW